MNNDIKRPEVKRWQENGNTSVVDVVLTLIGCVALLLVFHYTGAL